MLPKALKSCPKCNKSPNLVTLFTIRNFSFTNSKQCNPLWLSGFVFVIHPSTLWPWVRIPSTSGVQSKAVQLSENWSLLSIQIVFIFIFETLRSCCPPFGQKFFLFSDEKKDFEPTVVFIVAVVNVVSSDIIVVVVGFKSLFQFRFKCWRKESNFENVYSLDRRRH